MCYECWKEFKGWCKAFLLTEILLALLEALLLVLFIVFMVFLIMHMMVCQTWTSDASPGGIMNNTTTKSPYTKGADPIDDSNDGKENKQTAGADQPKATTLDPNVKCTWSPSKKTEAATRYYEQTEPTKLLREIDEANNSSDKLKLKFSPTMNISYSTAELEGQLEGIDVLALDDDSDGEEVSDQRMGALLALVKPAVAGARGGRRGTFGCVLTAVTHRWVLTAASCIEAIEEVDSLDSFVIMERGRRHAVADVQLHPLFQGANRSYDAAALRSEDPFHSAVTPLDLPTLVDYFLITIGERFTILGFGPFRSTEPTSEEREVRAVNVYALPHAMCREPEGDEGEGVRVGVAEGDDGRGGGWAPRHLSRGREEPHASGGCGAAAVCAGVRWARGAGAGTGAEGAACGYCAGTPLLRGRALLGLMAASPRACAVDCAPNTYVNLALLRDWIDMLLLPD